jgi:hypothetical protein
VLAGGAGGRAELMSTGSEELEISRTWWAGGRLGVMVVEEYTFIMAASYSDARGSVTPFASMVLNGKLVSSNATLTAVSNLPDSMSMAR